MALIAKAAPSGTGSFKLHPPGQWRMVCADVHDEGFKKKQWPGEAEREVQEVRIVWQSELVNEDNGEPYEHSEWLTLSLGEKAKLRWLLESWRGKPFTEDELVGFDVEKLIGVPAYVQIIHRPKKTTGEPKAEVKAIMQLPKGMEKLAVTPTFTKVADRVKGNGTAPVQQNQPAPPPPDEQPFEDEEDDLPF
jgi:hypothetical protein